jgi:MoaA/NifB/PqqE/SkfB family radical SAM enzyme
MVDMALTQSCNYGCIYCYGKLQKNKGKEITWYVMRDFIDDCAEIGVKSIAFVSDGESTLSPAFNYSVRYGYKKGLDIAVGTNGYLLDGHRLRATLHCLTYLRFNISAGEPKRYAEIMGVPERWFKVVVDNIKKAVELKKLLNLPVTIGLQMVLLPAFQDQILPLAKLGRELGVDYLVIKHCTDDENGSLGVNYKGYKELYDTIKEAEQLTTDSYLVKAKWSKIESEGDRGFEQCYAPPFLLQISGSGLVTTCGCFFNPKYGKYHIGNIATTRFKDIVFSNRYWEVMNELASPRFNAKTMCGKLCVQHKVSEALDQYKKGLITLERPEGDPPLHENFI